MAFDRKEETEFYNGLNTLASTCLSGNVGVWVVCLYRHSMYLLMSLSDKKFTLFLFLFASETHRHHFTVEHPITSPLSFLLQGKTFRHGILNTAGVDGIGQKCCLYISLQDSSIVIQVVLTSAVAS